MGTSPKDILGSEFVSSIQDPDTKAADVTDKLISDTIAGIRAHSATITDPVKRAEFNRGAAKIVKELEGKLVALQSPFDEVQTKRRVLKKQIDDAGQVN